MTLDVGRLVWGLKQWIILLARITVKKGVDLVRTRFPLCQESNFFISTTESVFLLKNRNWIERIEIFNVMLPNWWSADVKTSQISLTINR